MRELERRVVLSVLDRKWREHLYEMDYLREGIGLRAMAQRDPLVEYQREGYDLFAAMMDGIKEESVGFIFNLEVEVDEDTEQPAAVAPDASMPFAVAPEIHAKGLDDEHRQQPLQYSAPTLDGGGAAVSSEAPIQPPVSTPGRRATRLARAGQARSTRSATVRPAAADRRIRSASEPHSALSARSRSWPLRRQQPTPHAALDWVHAQSRAVHIHLSLRRSRRKASARQRSAPAVTTETSATPGSGMTDVDRPHVLRAPRTRDQLPRLAGREAAGVGRGGGRSRAPPSARAAGRDARPPRPPGRPERSVPPRA